MSKRKGTLRKIKASNFDVAAYNDHADKRSIEETNRSLYKNTRKLLEIVGKPELKPAARDGARLFNYLFAATESARKATAPFSGIEINPVVVSGTSKRFIAAAAVAEVLNNTILEVLTRRADFEQFMDKI